MIGLFQVGAQAHADHYSYIPHIGLLVLPVWEVEYWFCRSKFNRSLVVVASAIIAADLSWQTALQVAAGRSTVTLWSHAVEVNPEN